jgi:hypothetical protein
MKKTNIILFFLLFFTLNAHAKINYNGKPIEEGHINVIKGLAYDVVHSNSFKNEKERQKVLSNFAHAIIWLTQHHNSKTLYELNKIHTEETKEIKHLIATVEEVLDGKYPNIPIEAAMEKWNNTGKRVYIKREDKAIKNSKTNKKEYKTIYKFTLNPEQNETKNLVYKYDVQRTVENR